LKRGNSKIPSVRTYFRIKKGGQKSGGLGLSPKEAAASAKRTQPMVKIILTSQRKNKQLGGREKETGGPQLLEDSGKFGRGEFVGGGIPN